MMSTLYIGASGLKTHGEGLSVISNNIANVSTIGYKQQSMQFEDIFYATGPSGGGWESQAGAKVALSQVGMGAMPGAVRTLFAVQGPIEPGVSIFDMAIIGKGFFQVTDPDTNNKYYTRAGDFYLNKDGTLRDPNGYYVTGIPIEQGGKAPTASPLSGGEPIKLDVTSPCAPKATTAITLSMNAGITGDKAQNEKNEDPYFALLQSWDGTASPPLDTSKYGHMEPITVYDAQGNKHELALYMDRAYLYDSAGNPITGSDRVVEYILTETPAPVKVDNALDETGKVMPGYMVELEIPPYGYTEGAVLTQEEQDAITNSYKLPAAADGLLMAGTLTFSSNGQIIDMSAFVPTAASQALENWVPSPLENGLPQFSLNGQPITLDLGVRATDGWQHAPATAKDVNQIQGALPSMGQVTTRANASTSLGNTVSMQGLSQDGYPQGWLMDINITAKGVVVGMYSNGQNIEHYQIPVCRFTSEDGLRHEGNNLFSASPDKTGAMTMGVPGTENYGSIMAKSIEGSNVELSREITMMIMIQRGFQMNSKSITTADTMLQRAIELKRN